MRIAVAWSQVDERWGQRLASALVGRGLAVQTASVDENGVQEDDAESGLSLSVLRASAIIIPVLSASAGASRRMERLCRQAFDLTRQDWRRIVLPLVVDQLSEDDVWPFLRELPCIVARSSSPSGVKDTIARALRLLALPASERETAPSANLAGAAPLDLLIQGKSLLLREKATDAQTRLDRRHDWTRSFTRHGSPLATPTINWDSFQMRCAPMIAPSLSSHETPAPGWLAASPFIRWIAIVKRSSPPIAPSPSIPAARWPGAHAPTH